MDPKGKRVVVADNVTTPLPLKQAVAQCLFTEFQVRGAYPRLHQARRRF